MNTSEQNAQKPKKKKMVVLTISDKLKLIEQLENGVKGARLTQIYGISKATVSDIKRQKTAIKAYAAQLGITTTGKYSAQKKITKLRPKDFRFENLLYTWYTKQRRNDTPVVLKNFKEAAENLKQTLEYTSLVCNDEWVAQYRDRYKIIFDESENTESTQAVEKSESQSQSQQSVCSSFEHDDDQSRDETMKALDVIIKEEEELQQWLNQREVSEGDEENEDLQETDFSSAEKCALKAARKGIDDVIKLVGCTFNRGLWGQYETLRTVKELLIEDERTLTALQNIKTEECLSPK